LTLPFLDTLQKKELKIIQKLQRQQKTSISVGKAKALSFLMQFTTMNFRVTQTVVHLAVN
jgi:hypothetical protein